MADNAQKTPFNQSLNRFAEGKALDAIQQLGKALPCHVTAVFGSIVTVAFDVASAFNLPQVTCPIFGPEYIRYPTQVNDKGVVFPIDVYLGGASGLGGGVANLSVPANLSSLVFFPIASSAWSPTDDQNAVVIYGPDGVVLRDVGKKTILSVTPNGATLVGNLTVTGAITATQNVTAGQGGSDQVSLQNHTHPVTSAPGNTGKPTPGA